MPRLTWFGHSAFMIELMGKVMLVDPWLTHALSPIRPSDLEKVDYIIITHDHGDHMGDVLEIMKRHRKAKVISIFEIANYIGEALREPNRTIGGNIGGPIYVDDLEIVLTPAYHSSARGSPTGVVIMSKEGTVYHAGDTGIFAEMSFIGELYKPSVALLPIGGHFTMGIREAIKATELIKPQYVIPMHYNTFPVIRADPYKFKKLVEEKVPGVKVVILKPGESFEF
ncbi:MAG: metal-dependent hydrolase [Thermoprotei archaeon]|nr:MAG: metal-dependent hydrolase [Thermoprotei archaeon]